MDIWALRQQRLTQYRDRGRGGVLAPPLPPNRTGGSPASGFPVSGFSLKEAGALRTGPTDGPQTFGSLQVNCPRLVPPPVSPCGHSRWFVFRYSVVHPSTFLRSFAPRSLPVSSLL